MILIDLLLIFIDFLGGGPTKQDSLTTKPSDSHDASMTAGSLEAAKFAAGSLLQLVDECLKDGNPQGLAFCRPPKHHAGRASSTGFCLLNNVAIAVEYARIRYPDFVKRVLIFD